MTAKKHALTTVALLALCHVASLCTPCQADLILENIYGRARGLPRVYFVLRKSPDAPLLEPDFGFMPHSAVLDTGTCCIVMMIGTSNRLGFKIEPHARITASGVSGKEDFGVSEPLILGLAGFQLETPGNASYYQYLKPMRFAIWRRSIGLPLENSDIIGMPAMANRVVVLDTGRQHASGHVPADIRPAGDLDLPVCQFAFRLRMQDSRNDDEEGNIPPLPAYAAVPVIDEIVLEHQGKTSTATWLFDTGSTTSVISTRQAQRLGLLDAKGKQQVEPILKMPSGGVGGGMMWIPMYQLDRLIIPDVTGNKIVYTNACVGVRDITIAGRILDGLFGSNFLCPAQRLPGLTPMATSVPFEKVVIDFPRNQVGLRVKQVIREE